MHLLIDTNVILDVLLNRSEFVQNAANILRLNDTDFQKYISASAITDIYYIAYRELRNKKLVKDLISRLIKIVHVADVSEQDIILALESGWNDFEDSVQNSVAENHAFDVIITRNPQDYKKSVLQVYSPQDFLNQIYR